MRFLLVNHISSHPHLALCKSKGKSLVLYPHGFPSNSVVKNLPAMQETWVLSLGREDPLEEEMATHSSFLPENLTEEPDGLQSLGSQSQI